MNDIELFLSTFERIYVISMAKRADRRAGLLDSLTTAGVSEAFISERIRLHVPDHRNGEHPAKGCYASHAAICNECLQNNVQSVLVLEDDARIITNSPIGIKRQVDLVEWDVFYLGGNPKTDMIKIDINLIQVQDMLATHAIVYKQKAMKLIIENFSKGDYFYPIDQLLLRSQKDILSCIGITPMMFTQTSGLSDIERHPVDYWYMADNYRRHGELSTLDESKHEKVKVGFFIKCTKKDLPALRISIFSLISQKYSNFDIIVVSDTELQIEQTNAKCFVGTIEDAMKQFDGHICCELPCGNMVHSGVCFTVVQDYRISKDNSAICTDLLFSYDNKLHKKERARLIPWVAEI